MHTDQAPLPPGFDQHGAAPPGRLARLWRAFLKTLILACLVYQVPWLAAVLDQPLHVVMSNWVQQVAQPADEAAPFAVVKIDSERFRTAYQGRSPLDRVQLQADLQRLLDLRTATSPTQPLVQLLAVDLDLSPTSQEIAQPPGSSTVATCSSPLDRWVKQHRQRLLLIEPIAIEGLLSGPVDPGNPEPAALRQWLQCMTDGGVQFASPWLETDLLMVRNYSVRPGSSTQVLGIAMAQRICAPNSLPPPDPRYCQRVRKHLGAPEQATQAGEAERFMVAAHLRGQLQDWEPPLPTGVGSAGGLAGADTGVAADWPYAPAAAARYVILGAGYSTDDEYKTAVGELNGVDIHAVVAAYPFRQDNHLLGFSMDMVVGLLFGGLVSSCWRRYFISAQTSARVATAAKRSTPHLSAWRWRPGRQPELAYLWLVLLVLLWAGSVLLAAGLAAWFFRHADIWVSPAAMLTGLLLESAVLGSVHQARHLLEPANHCAPAPAAQPLPNAPPAQPWRALAWGLHYLPTLIWCGLVAWTVVELLTHMLHGVA